LRYFCTSTPEPCAYDDYFFPAELYGDKVLYQKVEEYRDRWHAEITHYVKVQKNVEELQSDVGGLEKIVEGIEKGKD
jgi:hypothetical protein